MPAGLPACPVTLPDRAMVSLSRQSPAFATIPLPAPAGSPRERSYQPSPPSHPPTILLKADFHPMSPYGGWQNQRRPRLDWIKCSLSGAPLSERRHRLARLGIVLLPVCATILNSIVQYMSSHHRLYPSAPLAQSEFRSRSGAGQRQRHAPWWLIIPRVVAVPFWTGSPGCHQTMARRQSTKYRTPSAPLRRHALQMTCVLVDVVGSGRRQAPRVARLPSLISPGPLRGSMRWQGPA